MTVAFSCNRNFSYDVVLTCCPSFSAGAAGQEERIYAGSRNHGIYSSGSERRNEVPRRLPGTESDSLFLSQGYNGGMYEAGLRLRRAVSPVPREGGSRPGREQGFREVTQRKKDLEDEEKILI